MKSSLLFFLLPLLFLGKISMAVEGPPEGEDNTLRVETSMFIPKGTEMTLSGSLKVPYSGLLSIIGKVNFKNNDNTIISVPSGNIGSGEFNFLGSNTIELEINGNYANIGRIKMGMSQGMLALNGHLSVLDFLDLQSGIIDISNNSSLFIDNFSPNAISFNDTPLNQSYIKGYLTRRISTGKKYLFPVGDDNSYHPFMIDKPLNDDVLSVSFDENVPEDIRSYNLDHDLMLVKSFGWRVESDLNQKNDFIAGLSLYNIPLGEMNNIQDVYNLSLLEYKGSASTGNTVSSYLIGTHLNSPGLYAFSKSIKDKIVNFIYIKAGNITTFEIPDFSQYSKISLKLYNHLGSIIYNNENYRNDLDVRDFPEGTYFYEIIIDRDEKQSIIRNYLEIVREK